jgi:hypothetical protein
VRYETVKAPGYWGVRGAVRIRTDARMQARHDERMSSRRLTTTFEPLPAAAAERQAGTCLLCHSVDSSVTWSGLAAGEHWRCASCSQMWDGKRLAAAANYAEYVRQHPTRDARPAADTGRR